MTKRGFTLIELLVSVGIFAVVMVIALGALLAVSESDRKAQSIKTITNNLGFALENMVRAIRTGADYSCNTWSISPPQDCQQGGSLITLALMCTAGELCLSARTGFQRSTDASLCGQTGMAVVGCIVRSQDNGSTWAPITAPEVVVENLTFYLVGAARWPDVTQPRVTITAIGYVEAPDLQKSEFKIQTTVTQRLYDQ